MKKGFLLILAIALILMQLNAEQIEIGRSVYVLDENTQTAIFKRWWGGTEDDSKLIIPASVDYEGVTYKVVTIGEDAINQNLVVENIIISDGVTKIERGASDFSVTRNTLPSFVLYCTSISVSPLGRIVNGTLECRKRS